MQASDVSSFCAQSHQHRSIQEFPGVGMAVTGLVVLQPSGQPLRLCSWKSFKSRGAAARDPCPQDCRWGLLLDWRCRRCRLLTSHLCLATGHLVRRLGLHLGLRQGRRHDVKGHVELLPEATATVLIGQFLAHVTTLEAHHLDIV